MTIALRPHRLFAVLLLVAGPALLAWHLLHPSAGYPAHDDDYLRHLSYVRALLAGDIWPPPYFGMIGAHAAAALSVKLAAAFGASLPPSRAMLLVSDLSLALMLGAVALRLQALDAGRALVVFLLVAFVLMPVLLAMQGRGYYGQTCSIGPYAAYLCALSWLADAPSLRRTLFTFELAVFGAWFYPDGFMLLSAGVALVWLLAGERKRATICFAAALIPTAALYGTQIALLSLDGAKQYDWTPQAITAGACVLAFAGVRRDEWAGLPRSTRVVLGVFAWALFWTLGLLLVDLASDGRVGYYALKNLFVLAYLLPFLAIEALRVTTAPLARIMTAAVIAACVVGLIRGPWMQVRSAYQWLVDAPSAFGPDDERCAEALLEQSPGCDKRVVIPKEKPNLLGRYGHHTSIRGYNPDAWLVEADIEPRVLEGLPLNFARLPEAIDCVWIAEILPLDDDPGGFSHASEHACAPELRFRLYRRQLPIP